MAVKFLSEDWMSGLADTVNANEAFKTAIANVSLNLQFVVTDVPDSEEVSYGIAIDGGTAAISGGELEGADATITNDYETAVAISKGELNTQMAFMTGKLKVGGDMAKIMMNQAALNAFSNAAKDLEVEY